MRRKEKIIIVSSFLVVGGIAAYIIYKKQTTKPGGTNDPEHIRIQNRINELIAYYAKPRGAMTGCGCGVDLFQMLDDYGEQGVRTYIYSYAKTGKIPIIEKPTWANHFKPKIEIDVAGIQNYSFTLFNNWIATGLYQKYRQCKNSQKGFDLNSLLSTAVKLAPLAILL